MGLKKNQQKEFAKTLYLSGENLTQKEIAERVGVSENTLSNWIKKEEWDNLRRSLLTTKQKQISQLYDQLEWLNDCISERDIKVANAKEADVISKITSSIQRLETETSIGDTVEVARNFIDYLRPQDLEIAKKITTLFDGYIQQKIKNG